MKTSVIPDRQFFAKKNKDHTLNLKAICIFASTGFFLGEDTYFNDTVALQPCTEYEIDENNFIKNENKYWHWYYEPRDISLKQSTEEFADLFEKITAHNLKNKKVILPLSGGIDSRTQAVAINNTKDLSCYSYKFEGSFDETKYGRKICEIKKYPFKEYVIKTGYLWNAIDRLAEINSCYADFINPRQMAVIDEIKDLGNIFYLGHWGDVLFDDMKVKDVLSFDEQVEIIFKKIVKKSGKELAEILWKEWDINGNFTDYLKERISILLKEINIENANSAIRAFKSVYWAPRWTSANMNIFSNYHPVYLPYYSSEMCDFICKIPEHILSGRKIQIEYIKLKSPELAEIPWQTFDPFNLYNYMNYDSKSNIPRRIIKKAKRVFREKISGKKNITRNWEIQFKGNENEVKLKSYLFEKKFNTDFISGKTAEYFYDKFVNENSVHYSHSVSMLLTLSVFNKMFRNKAND